MKWVVTSLILVGGATGVAMFLGNPNDTSLAGGPGGSPVSTGSSNEVNRSPLTLPLVDPRIIVSKSKRELILYSSGKVVRVCRVGLGFNPKDDKRAQGDGCTPEGEFYVCSKNPKSSYYLSLGLSYPNEEDAERGLRDGLITKAQRDQIVRAIKGHAIPPWNTKLGGEVFIHGNGSGSDWTFGCVALDNPDMKELFEAIERGTPVTIKP